MDGDLRVARGYSIVPQRGVIHNNMHDISGTLTASALGDGSSVVLDSAASEGDVTVTYAIPDGTTVTVGRGDLHYFSDDDAASINGYRVRSINGVAAATVVGGASVTASITYYQPLREDKTRPNLSLIHISEPTRPY